MLLFSYISSGVPHRSTWSQSPLLTRQPLHSSLSSTLIRFLAMNGLPTPHHSASALAHDSTNSYQFSAYGMQPQQPATLASYQITPSLHSMHSQYSSPGQNSSSSLSPSPEPHSTPLTIDGETHGISTSLGPTPGTSSDFSHLVNTNHGSQPSATDNTTDDEHLVISTLYVDNLAKAFFLDHTFRSHLQDFVRVRPRLSSFLCVVHH